MRAAALVVALAGMALAACASDAPPEAASVPDPAPASELRGATGDTLLVYKTPTCGCCTLWNEHMEAAGFTVVSRDVTDLQAVKDSLGVAPEYAACHTAVVGGYVVEGHVPATAVRRMLDEQPNGRVLAVPGMPLGSPGMEQGDRRDPYDVLLVAEGGRASVFEHVPGTPTQGVPAPR